MRARNWVWAVALGLGAAAGCAWNEAVTFEEDARVKELAAKSRPLPYRLAVAPIRLSLDPEAEKENRFTPRLRRDELTKRFVEHLRTLNLFREVVTVGEGASDTSTDALLTQAWEEKADLLLELDVSRYEVYWVGTNGLYIPNIVWWSFAWEAASYIDDETYGGGLDFSATLTSVHSNRKIESWSVRKDVTLDLNDFERGWIFFGFLRVPGALDESNWSKIDEVISPRTEIEANLELGKILGDNFRAITGTGDFATKMSKRLALVIGVDRWDDYRLNYVRFASDDAQGLEEALTAPEGGMDVPAKNLRTLVNERATLEGIRDAVKNFLAARATPEDLVLVYYAGYGCAAQDGLEAYLLAFDTKVDDLAKTALSLSELKAMLADVKARNVVLVLDTSFNADEASRCATKTVFPGQTVALSAEALSRLGGEGRVAVLAAGPEEGAQTFAPKKHGMFTHFLLEGVDPAAKAADKNKDLRVSFDELFDPAEGYVFRRTADETALSALPQNPVRFGTLNGAVDWAVFPGAAPPSAPKPAEGTAETPGPGEKTPEEPGAGEKPPGEPGSGEKKPEEPGAGEKEPG
jgi:hypothetical protein